MATPTTADIKVILDAGVYPTNSVSPETIYDFARPRKRYPSIEIEMVQPEGKSETKERTEQSYQFQITILTKQLGLGSDEVSTQRAIELEIVNLLNAAVLGDHKVINESFNWKRDYPDKAHPYFVHSVLTISIRRVVSTQAIPDGVLVIDVSASNIDNKPGSNYTYTNIYDVEISEGYRDHHEIVTSNNEEGTLIPLHFAGSFSGRFIGHMHVKADDIGNTGDKVNQLMTLRSNGEKPEAVFIYTQKDADSPNPATITETFTVEIDEVVRLYSHQDLVRYRLLGTLVKPSIITAV